MPLNVRVVVSAILIPVWLQSDRQSARRCYRDLGRVRAGHDNYPIVLIIIMQTMQFNAPIIPPLALNQMTMLLELPQCLRWFDDDLSFRRVYVVERPQTAIGNRLVFSTSWISGKFFIYPLGQFNTTTLLVLSLRKSFSSSKWLMHRNSGTPSLDWWM